MDAVYAPEQARELALVSRGINRQIGLMLDRRGRVRMVIVGDGCSIYIPELPRMRESGQRLRGWRLLHTHLSPDGLSQEDLMDLLFLRLDAIAALTVNESGAPVQWQAAWLLPGRDRHLEFENSRRESGKSGLSYELTVMRPWHDAGCDFSSIARHMENDFEKINIPGGSGADRAFLISVSPEPLSVQERNLDELCELALTAGLEVGGRLIQRVSAPNPRLILGKGKLAELEVKALDANAELLVFDGELSPAQLHNLADVTERKVLDRTQLILDIFAQHAVTKAGKLQVELAQLAYAQPRLAGRNRAMDRLMGGVGGRGPGESRLETDRRKSRERMDFLKRELDRLRERRALNRERRKRNGARLAALVGYTNAGKSTLLNKLTASSALAANHLFATLDPTARRLPIPGDKEIILMDTVGFIRNLPKELREAFRATLEELEMADMLVHVADASHPRLEEQILSVESILEDMELAGKPCVLALNKCDRLDADGLENLKNAYPNTVMLSAQNGSGLGSLLLRLSVAMQDAAAFGKPLSYRCSR